MSTSAGSGASAPRLPATIGRYRIIDRIGTGAMGMVYAADEDARDVTEQLIRDAGFEPVSAGDLENARAVEDFLGVIFAIAQQSGPFFYRMAPPDRL